jgi:hypothetical protein
VRAGAALLALQKGQSSDSVRSRQAHGLRHSVNRPVLGQLSQRLWGHRAINRCAYELQLLCRLSASSVGVARV